MALSGPEIERQIEMGNIRIEPYEAKHVGPNSVDLHMGARLYRYSRKGRVKVGRTWAIDSRNPPELKLVKELPGGGWLLKPGHLYLGSTAERTWCRGFVPVLDGRSSLGRLGVFCHITAGRGDNEWEGFWTTEHAVIEPVILYPGQRVFQITFDELTGEPRAYTGRYQAQPGVVGSRLGDAWGPPNGLNW